MTTAAQNYPSKPVRLIVPDAAGGAPDILGRILAQKLSESLGQQVIVDNRPGAAGLLAAELAARAAPDGYTLFMSTTSVWAILPSVKKNLPYDAANGFMPITRIASASNVMVINPSLPANSVADLVKLVKASPGTINYASAGIATPAHLAGEMLNLLADISPYLASDKDVKLTDFFEAATKDYNVGGKQYGLPREATTTNLVYNKELFAKNGVSLPDESWTWETYLDAAKKMTGGTGAQATWGTAGWAGVGAAPYYPYIKVWQEGGDIVDATRQKFTLHQSPAVDQMQWIADLINKQKVHPFGDSFPGQNMAEAWNTGRIGMVPSISVYANFNKATFEWDIAPIPKGKSRVINSVD
jgi:hypothetical protein